MHHHFKAPQKLQVASVLYFLYVFFARCCGSYLVCFAHFVCIFKASAITCFTIRLNRKMTDSRLKKELADVHKLDATSGVMAQPVSEGMFMYWVLYFREPTEIN